MPRWSSDGRQIAFYAGSDNTWSERIYVVSANGGSPQELMPGSQGGANPSWSPDGNFLVFGSPHKEVHSSGKPVIRLLDLRSNQVSELPGSEGLEFPVWSPDGRYISATEKQRLLLFDLTTHKWSELLGGTAVDHRAWFARWKIYLHQLRLGQSTTGRNPAGTTERRQDRVNRQPEGFPSRRRKRPVVRFDPGWCSTVSPWSR
jgi:Tol biopolymer transport system component